MDKKQDPVPRNSNNNLAKRFQPLGSPFANSHAALTVELWGNNALFSKQGKIIPLNGLNIDD